MEVERRLQVCFLKMNFEVHFVHPLWWSLLRKPLHSAITHLCAASNPPPPLSPQHVAQLRYDKCSSIPVGTPQPRFTLFYILPQSIPPLSVLLHLDRDSSIPSVLISSPQFVSVLHTPISAVLRAGYNLLDSHWRSLVRIFAPILESALVTHPPPFPCCAVGNALLNPHQSSSA